MRRIIKKEGLTRYSPIRVECSVDTLFVMERKCRQLKAGWEKKKRRTA
jgi:hypothetical protein